MNGWSLRHHQYTRSRASTGPVWSLPPADDRTGPRPVVVHAVRGSAGRRVTLRGKQAGVAHCVADVVELVLLAGVALNVEEAAASSLIEWRGGGPGTWRSP